MANARKSLMASRSPLSDSGAQRALLGGLPLAKEFESALAGSHLSPLRPTGVEIFQVNIGRVCNQTCRHCHVDAGPDRREVMTRETMQLCLKALDGCDIHTVDITGGAPEMNPNFRWFVEECRARGKHVIDRCNLTIIETPSHRDLPEFFARHQVEVVCSLPHFRELNTDKQRGEGVFADSVAALKRLNAVGYGQGGPLRLVLVSNPVGAFLPASQASAELEWKRALERDHGIVFDALYTITNMPISRYLQWLDESENLQGYMDLLVSAYNPSAAASVMCRNIISVGWDGFLYDCDFNQMLDMKVAATAPQHIANFSLDALNLREIQVDRHCFGCTAGAGSSCGGATTL